MKFRAVIVLVVMFLSAGCIVSGENQSAVNSAVNSTIDPNLTNTSPVIMISPQERLMNLAFDARVFALENGKESAVAEFSNISGRFVRDGGSIMAYSMDGVLLADSKRSGDIGSRFIADDHDSGMVRLMRDLATTGGGLFTDPASGKYWFVSDIDGSWWICAGPGPESQH